MYIEKWTRQVCLALNILWIYRIYEILVFFVKLLINTCAQCIPFREKLWTKKLKIGVPVSWKSQFLRITDRTTSSTHQSLPNGRLLHFRQPERIRIAHSNCGETQTVFVDFFNECLDRMFQKVFCQRNDLVCTDNKCHGKGCQPEHTNRPWLGRSSPS